MKSYCKLWFVAMLCLLFGAAAQATPMHVYSLPFKPDTPHDLTSSSWDNKVVIHGSAFGTFDTSAYKYSLHIKVSGSIQLGTARWDGENNEISGSHSEWQYVSGEETLELTKDVIAGITAEGGTFQLNAASGSVSLVDLIATERDPDEVEPDFTKGFTTSGTKLIDGNGNEFVMRGLNYSYAWQTDGYEHIRHAAEWGCNAIRINIGDGTASERDGNSWLSYTDKNTLKWLISLCEENKLVGVFSPHNQTGSNSTSDLLNAANYWAGMADVMNAHRGTVLLNITNEWMSEENAEKWADSYVQAIKIIRDAGIKNTIVVDVAGYGQGASVLAADEGSHARRVIAADTENNIMFSIHMYHCSAQNPTIARRNMDYALDLNVPLLIGEIAYEHKLGKEAWPNGGAVAWHAVLDYAREKNVSWLAWSWGGNGGNAETCDMFDGNGNIAENGRCMIYGNNGIKMTSTPCTIYSTHPGGPGLAYQYPEVPDDFKVYERADETWRNPDSGDRPDDPVNPDESEWFNHAFPYSIGSWDDEAFHIKSAMFATADESYTLHIFLSAYDSGSEIQLYYMDGSDMVKVIDYENITEGEYKVNLGTASADSRRRVREVTHSSALIDHVKADGFYVKGHGFSVSNVELRDADGNALSGIGDVETEAADEAPVEIYTLQGIRVAEMTPGNIYIVRQGDKVKKVIK